MSTRLLGVLLASTAVACVSQKEEEEEEDDPFDILDGYNPVSDDGSTGTTGTGEGSGASGTRDSGWSDEGSGSGSTPDDGVVVGELVGVASVIIQEFGCDIIWDMYGRHCDGCGLEWDAELMLSTVGSCDFGADTSGRFEVSAGAAYFQSQYWGAAIYGSGNISFATAGYVSGAGGYSYYYVGMASY